MNRVVMNRGVGSRHAVRRRAAGSYPSQGERPPPRLFTGREFAADMDEVRSGRCRAIAEGSVDAMDVRGREFDQDRQ
jgi:hypothetical protein